MYRLLLADCRVVLHNCSSTQLRVRLLASCRPGVHCYRHVYLQYPLRFIFYLQGNQQSSVVKGKAGNPPGVLGVSVECDTVPFSSPMLMVGQQERNPTCKKHGVGLLAVTI